jgi:hypothetical protein
MARSGETAAHQRWRSDNLCERDWNAEDLFPRISEVNDRFPKRKITSLDSTAKNQGVFESAWNKIVSQKLCQVDRGKNGRNDLHYYIRNSRIAFVAHEARGLSATL